MSILTVPEETDVAQRSRPSIGLLADPLNARRLESALHGRFEVVAHGESVLELLGSARRPFEVAVLAGDADLLARGGEVELLRNLRPDCRIVLVAPAAEQSTIRKALRRGVDGFVPHAVAEDALPASVAAVLAGQLAVPQSVRKHASWGIFSVRERQVLHLVARGLTNREIANRLCLSESTVKSHLSSSFRKLGISSRAEAAAAVLDPDTGLIRNSSLRPQSSTAQRGVSVQSGVSLQSSVSYEQRTPQVRLPQRWTDFHADRRRRQMHPGVANETACAMAGETAFATH